jgi:endonuclease/exonuclease/phosphatase family metal-dependent hydrolase
MAFSVTTWNVNRRATWWDFFEQSLRSDIALLQEVGRAPMPLGLGGIRKEIDDTRRWGSAILTRHPVVELTEVRNSFTKVPVPLIRSNPGAVVAGLIELPDEEPVVAVSLYGVFDDGYTVTSVHRALSDLTPLMDGKLRHRVVVGGDLNCSSQLPPPMRARHRTVFEHFTSLDLVDLTGLTAGSRPSLNDCPCEEQPCTHVHTFKRMGKVPYQDDWLFASKRLAARVESVVVHNGLDSPAWNYSDHAPIQAAFA